MVFIIISSIIKLDFTIALAPNVFVSLILACFGTLPYTCRYTASSALCFKIKLPSLSWMSGRPTNIMSEIFIQTIFLNFPLIWYNLFVPSKHIASHNLFPNILITWAYSYWSPLHTKFFFFRFILLLTRHLFLLLYLYSWAWQCLEASWTLFLWWHTRQSTRGVKWNCRGGRVSRLFFWDLPSSSKFLSFPLPFSCVLMFLRFSRAGME